MKKPHTPIKRTQWVGFAVLLLLYALATVFLTRTSRAQGVFMLFGNPVPKQSFTGVFSSLANFCIIFLAFYYGKLGFYTALAILIINIPKIFIQMVMSRNFASLPGLFQNVFVIVAITLIYFNNSKVRNYQTELHEQAVTDRLTGLPNKFACTELLHDLISRNEKFAVVSIDINRFKAINKTMGRDAGNKVLIEIAKRWKNAVESGLSGTRDFLSCQGGVEFALIIRDYQSDDDILKTISYYNSVLENRITIEGCDLFITASYGYTEYPTDEKDDDLLLTYAFTAMYEAKRVSSNRICRFTPDMLNAERTLEIERKIRTALDHNTLFYYLQPQYDISHRLRGFEALARMKDDDGSFISPAEFIPVAEKTGLIDMIDRRIFRDSATFLGELIRRTGVEITLSVNVSARHLMRNDFLDEIRSIIQTCDFPARCLEIEITESVMIDSAEEALRCITELKKMGTKIALDDFGTGYSSLSYLSTFPADILKVDKSFVDKMNTSESSKKYVAAIISIGHIMNFDVITEGVEETEQLETLRSIGCDYIQGYIWGRPMPPEEAEALVMREAHFNT